MATYTEIYALATNATMQQRIKTAIIKTATIILGEGLGAMTQTQTTKRQAFAKATLSGGLDLEIWSLAVCNNFVVAAAGLAATDGNIDDAISSIWDDMSGVTTLDATA